MRHGISNERSVVVVGHTLHRRRTIYIATLISLLPTSIVHSSQNQHSLDRRRLIHFEAHVAHDDLSITIYSVLIFSALAIRCQSATHTRTISPTIQCGYLNTSNYFCTSSCKLSAKNSETLRFAIVHQPIQIRFL